MPATFHHYTPDFRLPNGIIPETKGRFLPVDRAKHLFIREQYPDLDVRFVFSNSKAKIAPGSKTTLAQWADKHGFKWADKLIPAAWIAEPGPQRSIEEVLAGGPRGFEDFIVSVRRRA